MRTPKLDTQIIGITSLGHSLCHVYMLILAGALIPIATSLNSSLTVITSLGTICYFAFGLGSIPAGLFVTKTNPKLTLKFFFVFSALSCALIALSNSLWIFGLGLTCLGMFGSLYHVSGLTLISQNIGKKGHAMGIHGVAGSFGIAIAPLLTGLILSFSNWRGVYAMMAIPGLLGFLMLQFNPSIRSEHGTSDQPESKSHTFNQAMLPFFVIMLLVMGINGLVYRGFLTALPTYLSQTVRIGTMSNILTGGLLSTVILSVGMIGQYLGGRLSDRFKMTHLYLAFIALTLPFMLLMAFIHSNWLLPAALMFSLFHFPQQPVENHLISKFMPPRLVGSGYGIKFTFTFGMGSFASGLVGIVTDHQGMAAVFPILGGLILISASLVAFLAFQKRVQTF